VGSRDFLASHDLNFGSLESKARKYIKKGLSVLYVAENNHMEGMIVLAHSVRPNAAKVLRWFEKEGIHRIYLISGDEKAVVQNLSTSMGFRGCEGGLLPDDKAQFIEKLETSGYHVVMIGDGVNDALALAKATVGISLGAGGSEVAVEAADIALANNDLEGLIYLKCLSLKMLRIAEQNFWIASISNAAGVMLGFMGMLPVALAGAFHVSHSLGIILNTSRLLRWRGPFNE
jgi:cation-transporting P-type ATPase C